MFISGGGGKTKNISACSKVFAPPPFRVIFGNILLKTLLRKGVQTWRELSKQASKYDCTWLSLYMYRSISSFSSFSSITVINIHGLHCFNLCKSIAWNLHSITCNRNMPDNNLGHTFPPFEDMGNIYFPLQTQWRARSYTLTRILSVGCIFERRCQVQAEWLIVFIGV